jgi:hypothetical protein
LQVCGGHGHCLGIVSTYCECNTGYSGAGCGSCSRGYIRLGGRCVLLPGALALCSDGVRNGNEEGVDCGGTCASECTASGVALMGDVGGISIKSVSGSWAQTCTWYDV